MPKRSAARAVARRLLPALPLLLGTARAAADSPSRAAPPTPSGSRPPPRSGSSAATRLAPGFDDANAAMRAGRFTGLDEIAVPLTFAWPEHDRLVGRPKRLPAARAQRDAAGCGHLPTWDDPEQVARVLLEGSGG